MKRISRLSKKEFSTQDFEMECIATEMAVLVPVWETRYVTLCGDVLSVYKSKDPKGDIEYRTEMTDLMVEPDKEMV